MYGGVDVQADNPDEGQDQGQHQSVRDTGGRMLYCFVERHVFERVGSHHIAFYSSIRGILGVKYHANRAKRALGEPTQTSAHLATDSQPPPAALVTETVKDFPSAAPVYTTW